MKLARDGIEALKLVSYVTSHIPRRFEAGRIMIARDFVGSDLPAVDAVREIPGQDETVSACGSWLQRIDEAERSGIGLIVRRCRIVTEVGEQPIIDEIIPEFPQEVVPCTPQPGRFDCNLGVIRHQAHAAVIQITRVDTGRVEVQAAQRVFLPEFVDVLPAQIGLDVAVEIILRLAGWVRQRPHQCDFDRLGGRIRHGVCQNGTGNARIIGIERDQRRVRLKLHLDRQFRRIEVDGGEGVLSVECRAGQPGQTGVAGRMIAVR